MSSPVSWAHCTTKTKQEKHCRLKKQLSRGRARHRHLAQVGDELDLPTEIEIQLPFKLFPVICADFPNQLQAIFSPLQGVSKAQPGTLSCVIPHNEAGDRSGLAAGRATDLTAPANNALCGHVFSQILLRQSFRSILQIPSVVIPAGQAGGR